MNENGSYSAQQAATDAAQRAVPRAEVAMSVAKPMPFVQRVNQRLASANARLRGIDGRLTEFLDRFGNMAPPYEPMCGDFDEDCPASGRTNASLDELESLCARLESIVDQVESIA